MRIVSSIVLASLGIGLQAAVTLQPAAHRFVAPGPAVERSAAGGLSAGRLAESPCPKCVRIFDGQTWTGWEHDPANWTIVDGAMRGFGSGARSAFTQADYGNFRLIVTSRMAPVNKDHLGVLFWGPRPDAGSLAFTRNIQVQPPHAAMWDYFENKALEREMLVPGSRDYEAWNTIEILANLGKGTLRVAVDGREIMRYTDKDPSRLVKGPIGMQKHGSGGSEYKDIFVETDPAEDVLYTVKAK